MTFRSFLFILTIALSLQARSQSLYFPPLTGTTWDTVVPQSLGWCQPRIDSLYNYLQVKNSKSFIILKGGKIVLEKYFGTYTADSAHYWASASKSLASFITGMAQQKGFINISNKVSQYIGTGWTSAPPAKEDMITVKHLLTMTSGLDDSPPSCSSEDTAKACLIYKVDAGTRWAYHTGAYKKVQDVVAAATGQNYNAVTNSWIKTHTGMSGIWYEQVFYSKARDMARFGLLCMNRGIWSSDTIMKDTAYFHAMINTSQNFNLSYGYLWWLNGKPTYMNPGIQAVLTGPLIPNCPSDMFAALGKNDQKIYVVPSLDMIVVRQGSSADNVTFALSTFDNTLWDYINKLSCSATGIAENSEAVSGKIYPNPVTTIVNIDNTAFGISKVQVYDVLGHCLHSDSDLRAKSLISIDFSGFDKGVYMIGLQNDAGASMVKKIIKN